MRSGSPTALRRTGLARSTRQACSPDASRHSYRIGNALPRAVEIRIRTSVVLAACRVLHFPDTDYERQAGAASLADDAPAADGRERESARHDADRAVARRNISQKRGSRCVQPPSADRELAAHATPPGNLCPHRTVGVDRGHRPAVRQHARGQRAVWPVDVNAKATAPVVEGGSGRPRVRRNDPVGKRYRACSFRRRDRGGLWPHRARAKYEGYCEYSERFEFGQSCGELPAVGDAQVDDCKAR